MRTFIRIRIDLAKNFFQEHALEREGAPAVELLELALADETLPEEARQATEMLSSHGDGPDDRIDDLEKKIARASGRNEPSQLLDEIPAFGPLIASAIVAFTPDPSVFRSGSDFSASLGITPSQNSSGGKDKLGAITKKGQPNISARC